MELLDLPLVLLARRQPRPRTRAHRIGPDPMFTQLCGDREGETVYRALPAGWPVPL